MSNFISKVKNLSQKAAEIKAAMQQVPSKVAEIRETVAATAGQLQQLRVDVQSSVTDLKADNEQRISQAMQEINGSLDIFIEAGFELGGMDLEISPVQRLLVRFTKLEEVHPSKLRLLVSANQDRRTTHAILTSMLQAGEMAETVDLALLSYRELIVGIGPIPSVRICWRSEEAMEVEAAAKTARTIPVPPPVPQTAPVVPQPEFAQSSYFEKRTPQITQATSHSIPPRPAIRISAPIKSPVEESSVVEPAHKLQDVGIVAETDPLARFKKMPDLSKFRK